jgi:hypothetical protein
MANECGKRIPYKQSDICMLEAGHKGGCGPLGATLEECRRLLRFSLKVISRGTDVQLIDARNFIEARMGGSSREPSPVLIELWEDSK